jgi:hypothetical protein
MSSHHESKFETIEFSSHIRSAVIPPKLSNN